jgi:hypothetical protein
MQYQGNMAILDFFKLFSQDSDSARQIYPEIDFFQKKVVKQQKFEKKSSKICHFPIQFSLKLL